MNIDFNNFKLYDPLLEEPNTIPNASGLYLIVGRNQECLLKLFSNAEIPLLNGYPIVYIGISKKQGLRNRDYKNHFKGTARNSTLRKSLGALNQWQESRVYYKEGKYKFTAVCENLLTCWMKINLMMYYEVLDVDIENIEEMLINELSPPLNIAKNHSKKNMEFRAYLKCLRK